FLEEGARIVLAGHDPDAGQAAAAALASVGPCTFLRCDATQPDQVEQLFAGACSALGGLDVLYHLAGASGRRQGDGALHECTDAGWQATLAVNLTSVFLTNRAAVRHWLERQSPGVILNLASVLALAPAPRHFDTCAYAA